MAYVYYIPPAPLPPVQERPSLCSPARSTGFICGPALIFLGGASALMIGFFERKPAIIWPIVSFGALLCFLGVYLARRHVKHWREAEQERQRAMWRTPRGQPGDARRSGGDGVVRPEFDVPMYCLEAPSRPLVRPSSDRTARSSRYGTSGGGGGGGCQQHDNEYWCALAVPLSPDDVNDSEYLNWAAMTLVVQPHFKFASASPSSVAGGASAAAAGGGDGGGGGAAAAANGVSPGVLTRSMSRATYSGFSRARDGGGGDGGDGGMEHASEPTLAAVSLTLMRSPSLGTRSAHGSIHAGGVNSGSSERRVGRGSRTGRIGDLLSLFAAVAGNGGAGDAPPEVDENGVELAGIKALAAQQAAAAAATATAGAQRQASAPPLPAAGAAAALPLAASPAPAAGPSGDGTSAQQQHQHQHKASPGGAAATATGVAASPSEGGRAEWKMEDAEGDGGPQRPEEDVRGDGVAAGQPTVGG